VSDPTTEEVIRYAGEQQEKAEAAKRLVSETVAGLLSDNVEHYSVTLWSGAVQNWLPQGVRVGILHGGIKGYHVFNLDETDTSYIKSVVINMIHGIAEGYFLK
jgi:hypothetical protein